MYIGVVSMKEERTVMNKMNAEDANERCVCMYACLCLCVYVCRRCEYGRRKHGCEQDEC